MPENHELEKQIEELKGLLESHKKEDDDFHTYVRASRGGNSSGNVMESSGKLFKWIQSIIAIVVVIVGLGVNYGVTKTKIDVLQEKVTTYERVLNNRIVKTEHDVHELQLKQAGDDQLLQNMQNDISEIKSDVKALVERRPR